MRGDDLILVDELPGELDGEGVVALGVLRDHGELAPTDAAAGVDLFHRHLGGSAALHAVAGALLGQGHHETHDDLVAKGVRDSRQRQQHDETAQEHARSCHCVLLVIENTGPAIRCNEVGGS